MQLETRCYSCEAPVIFAEGKDICRCGACGRFNSRPKSEKQESDLMKYANERRNLGEFDKAEAAYDKVLQKNLGEHEARWGILLCRRGVIYLEDAATGEVVITCRRTANASITTDPDFKRACEDAPVQVRRQYERDAEYIDAIQREIRGMGKEDGYDVFICYKETEPGTGERTDDSRRALSMYQTLTRRGFRVFYAPVSLKNHLGANYEAAIFHAIETAQVMLALGTKPEYFRTTWMQSEWRRFLEKVDAGERKLLIPLYQGFAPSQLPGEFSDRFLQGLDMSDMGFMFDLENMLDKVVRKDDEEDENQKLRDEIERMKKAEEERLRNEEQERLRKAEEELAKIRQAEKEREAEKARLAAAQKRAEEEAKRKAEAERLRKAEEELERLKKAEANRIAEEQRAKQENLEEEKTVVVQRRRRKREEISISKDNTFDTIAEKRQEEYSNQQHVDQDGEIKDSWEQIFAAIDDGSYKEKYAVGNTKLLDLGPEGEVHMQIVAFDVDERDDGKGKAPITWISKELLKNERRMYPEYSLKYLSKKPDGWKNSELRKKLRTDVLPQVPAMVAKRILPVVKIHTALNDKADEYDESSVDESTVDELWIPSWKEISKGVYSEAFANIESRVKVIVGGSEENWWLRSISPAAGHTKRRGEYKMVYFAEGEVISTFDGDRIKKSLSVRQGIALGFCT